MDSFFKLNKSSSENINSDVYSKKAENIWSMLDDMASTDPDSYKKFIEKTLKEGKEAMKPPVSHIWNKIPAPKTDDDPIPVCGTAIDYKSNHSIVSLAFNPEILDKYGKSCKNDLEREMLIDLGFKFVSNQCKVDINTNKFEVIKDDCFGNLNECITKLTKREDSGATASSEPTLEDIKKDIPDSIFNKLANMNFKTELDPKKETKREEPCIKKNLIEELDSTSDGITTKKVFIEELDSNIQKTPTYEEKIDNSNDDSTKAIYDLKINLTGINSMNECSLDIDENFLTLNTTKIYSELKISLMDLKNKYDFQAENIEAKFVKKTSVLRVKVNLFVKF